MGSARVGCFCMQDFTDLVRRRHGVVPFISPGLSSSGSQGDRPDRLRREDFPVQVIDGQLDDPSSGQSAALLADPVDALNCQRGKSE